MACYHTILVALDGSPDADAALRHAADLARDQHARIVLVTIVPRRPQPVDAATIVAIRELERSFAQALRAAVDSVPADIGVESRLARGKPAHEILEVARELQPDLIIMGSRGHGRLREALIGSTSATVVRRSTSPVLLIRANHGDATSPAHRPSAPVEHRVGTAQNVPAGDVGEAEVAHQAAADRTSVQATRSSS